MVEPTAAAAAAPPAKDKYENVTPGYKDREQLYRMIISQLFYDGFTSVAVNLSNMVKAHPSCPPSNKLLKMAAVGIREEIEKKESSLAPPVSRALDLEFETDVTTISPEAATYETCYVTSHKSPCRAGAFNLAGTLVATGSEDASIKILDINRMLTKATLPPEMKESQKQSMETHPVIRTLYDHNAEVTCLEFHPTAQILASGGRDYTLKIFDFSKPSVKKATKYVNEAAELRCLAYHPSGDYLLAGTNNPTLRLYDVETFQCFVSPHASDQHVGPITDVKYAFHGRFYATSSKDGDIKLWDGVSNRCVNTFAKAHDGAEVCSIQFSNNGKYLLSSGKDSLVKLWELTASRCLICYTGAGATGPQHHRTQAVFNHTEDFVLFPDERTTSLCSWDARNAERQRLLSLGHNGLIKRIVHSPNAAAFLTCSDDFRARFWCRKPSIV